MPDRPERPSNPAAERARAAIAARRNQVNNKVYDSQWRVLSRMFRDQHPLCEMCLREGIYKPSEHTDHIIPVVQRPDLRLDPTNLRAICHSHHSQTTRNLQATGRNELPD